MPERTKVGGQATIFMILILTFFLGSSLSLILLLTHWHQKVKLQFNLDTCVAETTRELKALQNFIESSNSRMKSLRVSIAVAVDPRIQSALKLWLKAEYTSQELQRTKWILKQTSWLRGKSCNSTRSYHHLFPLPLPPLLWSRPLADTIGEQPLEWKGERKNARLKIQPFKNPRHSAAEVLFGDTSWTATWTGAY